ncbi:LPXTG cell wall anchor domain-containing protein [Lentzea jiangxiensis]|uniref:LPXTG-motif cell wall anchor domain-containing protein n=1 Tax=Lentzea jiangxiensis TaxID=641025 RepID=A0A1H0W298_9PSEU|nr:LPXTG cell wall anchor domain-containing protein [Lentzea jiangxiensis]SDP84516.1 LPXTG-motif cell wall anchor domain-containing protein [Lentzea jiangxiensis]
MYGGKIVPPAAVAGTASAVTLANTGASVGWLLFGGVALVVSGLALRLVVLRRPAKREA